MNNHLPRWIFTSFRKHFDDNLIDTKLYIEGVHRNLSADANWMEFRMDGPWSKELSKNLWIHFVEVNILIVIGIDYTNSYTINKKEGIVRELFNKTVPIYRYGDPIEDAENDGTLVGCMDLERTQRRPIEVKRFGQIEPKTPILQSSVNGRYFMELRT